MQIARLPLGVCRRATLPFDLPAPPPTDLEREVRIAAVLYALSVADIPPKPVRATLPLANKELARR